MSVCDAYAEFDWAAEDYQHESIVVPSGYYRVDAYYLDSAPDPGADMFILFQLTPTSERIARFDDLVKLFFRLSQTRA